MLTVYTGANRDLSDALVRRAEIALAEGDQTLIVVVPKQLTLLTERLLLNGLRLRGSFRIQVLSPARLCTRAFEEAGFPAGVRVDERGRVMLVRRAIREAEGLTIYKNAGRLCGFAEKCARQMELFTQGGVDAEALRSCAQDCAGTSRMKLNDLAAIMERYQALAAGQYQDGENELIEAADRIARAGFVRDARFCFFGFDVMPPTLTRLIAAIAAEAPSEMFFACPDGGRDADVYLPQSSQLKRLAEDCEAAGAALERRRADAAARTDAIALLARELYAYPSKSAAIEPEGVHMAFAKDVREECAIAAAKARTLAMRGVRWGEMQVLCADMEAYRQPLIDAFAQYGVPLFLDANRPVSRMAAAEYLLTALRMVEKNFRSEDVFAMMRTGCADITRDEADRLTNYAIKRGLDGGRWLRPLTRGAEEEIEALEPVRRRLIAPAAALKERLKSAETLTDQLAAAFGFLEETKAYEKSLALQRQFEASGMRAAAGTLSQAWNRIIGAMDQMAALMGGQKLSLRELTRTLSESLDAAILKPLPQSGDAVYAQSVGRMLMQRAKALFVLGLSDRSGASEEGLLTPAQRRAVVVRTKAYLGPDAEDAARMRRLYLKEALGMAEETVWLSCAMTGGDGAAQRPGLEIALTREIFPTLAPMGAAEIARLLLCAPSAAAGGAARAIAARRTGRAAEAADLSAAAALKRVSDRLPDVRDRLNQIASMLSGNAARGILNPETARGLYGRLQTQSITRLEQFARCPFSYYMKYGLRAERIEPFEMTRRDEGIFLHEAVNAFLRAYGRELNEMDGSDAEVRMDRIAAELLRNQVTGTPMEDSASARAQARAIRATARRCARVLAEQMRGSRFRADQLERSFGREDGALAFRAGETILEGRVDRVDTWEQGDSLRVIDFKLGGKSLDPAGVYYGLELQQAVYLGATTKRTGARSAGVYYFALDEGVVDTQATDPVSVERERAKRMKMSGLLPADPELIEAQTPDPERVFGVRVNRDGTLDARAARASDADYARLMRHAQRIAAAEIGRILSGDARTSPVNRGGTMPCGYCDYPGACLFDAKLNAGSVRRIKPMNWQDAFERMASDDDSDKGRRGSRE